MRIFKKLVLSGSLMALGLCAQAQPPGGGPPADPPVPIPVDGGVGLLLAAGATYGLSRLRKKKAEEA